MIARRSTVLVVDDIQETAEYVTKVLGYLPQIEVVGRAATGLEAIEAAARLEPDLILMDVCMPELDGISAAERVHAEMPGVRIVMMSIQGGADYLARALRAGASEYLVKPFSADELSQALASALGHQVGGVLPNNPPVATPGEVAVRGYRPTPLVAEPEVALARPQGAAHPVVVQSTQSVLDMMTASVMSRKQAADLRPVGAEATGSPIAGPIPMGEAGLEVTLESSSGREPSRSGEQFAATEYGQRNRRIRELAHDAKYRDETGTRASCPDCGARFAAEPWFRVRTVGHNIPLSRVRENETRELVKYDQCMGCNADQGTRTPDEWRKRAIAGTREPLHEITDEEKRVRARVKWERQSRRKEERGHIGLDAVPEHLLSHDEVFAQALVDAEYRMDHDAPSQAGQLKAALVVQEAALKRIHDRPMKGLFGLRTDYHGQAARVSGAEQKLADLRKLLEVEVDRVAAVRAAARLECLELEESGALLECPCVACAQNFDERAEGYAMERADERREAWRARFRPSYPTSRYRRGRY